MTENTEEKVQGLYASLANGTRADFGGKKDQAQSYYRDFVDFVETSIGLAGLDLRECSLLDIGCGCGWSSYFFATKGFETTGIDLNPEDFEPEKTERLSLLAGSAMDLDFADSSFQVVVIYQCLEHIPDPEKALSEMIRVCKSGGVICVVGPNLLNPLDPLKSLMRGVHQRDLPVRRTPEMAFHPYGDTLFEYLASVPRTLFLLFKKLLSPSPQFLMRTPDNRPPFHGDNDSCYLCNSVDLERYFRKKQTRVLQVGKFGRLPVSRLLTSGTWIAVQKAT